MLQNIEVKNLLILFLTPSLTMIHAHNHCLSSDLHNLLPGSSIPLSSNFSCKLMLECYCFANENTITFYLLSQFKCSGNRSCRYENYNWENSAIVLNMFCIINLIINSVFGYAGLKEPLIHPGNFFGRHYEIEKTRQLRMEF